MVPAQAASPPNLAGGILRPFLKWAGGKRWLVDQYPELFPNIYRLYVEPFLGGGAVFFALDPATSVLSDCNAELIKTYAAIRDDWAAVVKALERHQQGHCLRYFYRVRDQRPRTAAECAGRLLYLNRTCWNGLYRVNLAGAFNVPIGTKSAVILPNDDFQLVAQRLRRATLRCCDFETSIDAARQDDFVFVDPPYTVMHNMNGFVKYNDRLFSWSDQVRLHLAVKRAAQRGAKVLVLNANHRSVRDLYCEFPHQLILPRKSVLAANPCRRRQVEELAIKCWEK